ncbi:hypothetical protein NU195Hw_g3322t1 [Hortaea werneckii]
MAKEKPETPRNKVSLASAKAVPIFLSLLVVYASYVVVGPFSIDYLINNEDPEKRNISAGIALPIVWFVLLIPVATSYARLLYVVSKDPGYIPFGDDEAAEAPPPDFWMRDVFVCTPQGLPIWCHHCRNWKPDRAHHNRDTGRCTKKQDHFCPWVGGVVGERSMKFFAQFLCYSLTLSTYLMILMAYYVHKDRSHVQWIVALGLGGFFVFFTLGMVINTMRMIFHNATTIEEAGPRTILMAVVLPPELQGDAIGRPSPIYSPPTSRSGHSDSEQPFVSEIDDPSHSSYFSKGGSRGWPLRRLARSKAWKGTVTYPLPNNLPTDRPPIPAPEPRTFAILETWPGMNPWDLGSTYLNFTAVFGTKLHHWLLPIRHSPCCEHTSAVSLYPLGPQFEEMLEEVGMVQREFKNAQDPSRPRDKSNRKRRPRLGEGWQNGERPDGWISEKEARRVRNQARARMRIDDDFVP